MLSRHRLRQRRRRRSHPRKRRHQLGLRHRRPGRDRRSSRAPEARQRSGKAAVRIGAERHRAAVHFLEEPAISDFDQARPATQANHVTALRRFYVETPDNIREIEHPRVFHTAHATPVQAPSRTGQRSPTDCRPAWLAWNVSVGCGEHHSPERRRGFIRRHAVARSPFLAPQGKRAAVLILECTAIDRIDHRAPTTDAQQVTALRRRDVVLPYDIRHVEHHRVWRAADAAAVDAGPRAWQRPPLNVSAHRVRPAGRCSDSSCGEACRPGTRRPTSPDNTSHSAQACCRRALHFHRSGRPSSAVSRPIARR